MEKEEKDIAIVVAERLQALRSRKSVKEGKRYTQDDMAEFLGVVPRTYSNWETHQSTPRVKDIKKIAEKLNVSTDYILGGIEATDHDSSYILEKVGLSEDAQKIWSDMMSQMAYPRETLNYLLEKCNFADVILSLDAYIAQAAISTFRREQLPKKLHKIPRQFSSLDEISFALEQGMTIGNPADDAKLDAKEKLLLMEYNSNKSFMVLLDKLKKVDTSALSVDDLNKYLENEEICEIIQKTAEFKKAFLACKELIDVKDYSLVIETQDDGYDEFCPGITDLIVEKASLDPELIANRLFKYTLLSEIKYSFKDKNKS